MTVMLKDAPGGEEFIESIADAVQKLGLLYAHSPGDKAHPHLETFIDGIEAGIIEAVGAVKAPIILDALRRAVMTRKHEIEAAGATSRELN